MLRLLAAPLAAQFTTLMMTMPWRGVPGTPLRPTEGKDNSKACLKTIWPRVHKETENEDQAQGQTYKL